MNIRAKPAKQIGLTGASNSKVALVSAEVPASIGLELRRHTVKKGCWARALAPTLEWQHRQGLLPPDQQLPGGQEPVPGSPLWIGLARSLSFREKLCHEYLRKVHINVGELAIACAAEAHFAVSQPGHRLLGGTDSQVALGALVKSRADSLLNAELEASLPVLLGYDIYPGYFWLPSDEMIAAFQKRRAQRRGQESRLYDRGSPEVSHPRNSH